MLIIYMIPLEKLDKSMLINAGKPRLGPVYELHLKCKSRFKYALRFIKNNENMLRKEALGKILADLKPKTFWSEIKNMNNCKTPLPTSIGWGIWWTTGCRILANTFA